MANFVTQSATRECNLTPNGELTVVERLASLLDSGQFADVEINVGTGKDTQKFKAHRILLATASQPLNNLLSSEKTEPGGTVTLNVTDIDPESFQHILKYIYTDDVKISSVGEAIDLIKYAEKWGLEPLGKKSVKFIHQYLDEYEPTSEEYKNDLCELIMFSDEEEDKLNMRCWEVLLKYVNEVIPCQSFLNMSESTLLKLLKHHDFHYKSQLNLFEAIRDWGMNQILEKNLPVTKLQSIIGRLLKHIKMDGIQDDEFSNTVLPSDCLEKADLISYFMGRGLEIPRDLAFNSSGVRSNTNRKGISSDYEKATRFKKGYKIPGQEIYREHELRFRVDRDVILYGVAFGFLFSNIDMGITVHCQGPWEINQWSDIVKTYCRVSWETMKTADIRLMFSEPVKIMANHSYKILVRVGRMSAGPSEVDLWGGGEGTSVVDTQDAIFYFLKNAVHPSKEVQDKDKDDQPSMITKLIYEIEGKEKPIGIGDLSIREPTPQEENVCQSNEESVALTHSSSVNLSPTSPLPLASSSNIPRPYSPCSSPIPKPFSPVKGPLTPSLPSTPTENPSSASPFFTQTKIYPSLSTLASTSSEEISKDPSPPSSPAYKRKFHVAEITPKKTYLTQIPKLPEPEPPWTKRRDSITVSDGKAPQSPFRVGKDVPYTEPRSLPWQRKASLTKKEELPVFSFKPRPTTSTSKYLSSDRQQRDWEIPSKPKDFLYMSSFGSKREPSVTRSTVREPSLSRTTREYTPLSTKTDYNTFGKSRLGSSYSFATPYSSTQSPGLSTSTRFGQVSKIPKSDASSTYTPSSYSSNSNSVASPYSSTRSPTTSSYAPKKAASPAPFSSNYSKYNSTFKSPSSSSKPSESIYDKPSRFSTSYSSPKQNSFDYNSSHGAPNKTNQQPTSYADKSYGKSLNSSSDSPSRFGRSSNAYKPMSQASSNLGTTNGFKKETSPGYTFKGKAYGTSSLYPSHVSSVKSKFSGTGGSSGGFGKYYKR